MADLITQDKLRATKTDSNQLQKQFEARQNEAQKGINTTMNTSLKGQKQGLKDAYVQNRDDLTAERQDTNKQYRAVSQDVQTQINQNGQALNQFAKTRGINRGAGSQQSLQLNQVRSTAMGQIQAQRNKALQENARQAVLAKGDYQNRVAQAIKNNDYTKAAALLDDYNNQNAWRENQAKILAQYGNFDAYGQLYGNQQAQNMRDMWIATNPELAYNTGAITAERCKEITGKAAPGYEPVGGGGGGSGYWDSGDWWWYTPESGYSGGGASTPSSTPVVIDAVNGASPVLGHWPSA